MTRPTNVEIVVSAGILLLLGVICGGVWWSQYQFNPAVLAVGAHLRQQPPSQMGATPPTAVEALISVGGLVAISPSETYDRQTLSNKINGKAELYLQAGFKGLKTQRYGLPHDSQQWLELLIYDMQNDRNAFSVFSEQRRSQGQSLGLGQAAYTAANGIFLSQGPYYVEIIAAQTSDVLIHQATALAHAFVEKHPAQKRTKDERDLFPSQNRIPDSVALLASDAFGFEGFDHVYTSRYRIDGQEVTAFLSKRDSPAAAAALANAYADFLLRFGGTAQTLPEQPPGTRMIEILDAFEMIFAKGPYVGGVHEAATQTQAQALVRPLDQAVSEALR